LLNNYNTDFLVEEISDYQKLETSKDLLKTIEQQYSNKIKSNILSKTYKTKPEKNLCTFDNFVRKIT